MRCGRCAACLHLWLCDGIGHERGSIACDPGKLNRNLVLSDFAEKPTVCYLVQKRVDPRPARRPFPKGAREPNSVSCAPAPSRREGLGGEGACHSISQDSVAHT